jgi:hypothetical protein
MAAVVVCGCVALAIGLALDAPHLDDTGQVGELYTDATAGPGAAFWLEVAGGALLVFAGGGLLVGARGSGVGRSAPAAAAAGASRSRTAR